MQRDINCPKCGEDHWTKRSDTPGKFRCLVCTRKNAELRRDRLVSEGLTRGGTPRVLPRTEDRFWAHVSKTDGCWLWIPRYLGKLLPEGEKHKSTLSNYGTFWDKESGRNVLAHRYSYELHKGKIPEGWDWTIDHLCNVTKCVNPDHLEVVTRSENSLRREQRKKSHL